MYYYTFLALLAFTPSFSHAQAPANFRELVTVIIDLINLVIPIILAVTVLVIMWGIIKGWIIGAGDERSIESGKQTVLVGFIVLALMFGVWGILAILRRTFFGV